MNRKIELRARICRKDPSLPRYVVVPARDVAVWNLNQTTMVELNVNDVELGRRSLKRWGKGRDCWFFDLTDALCRRAAIDSGDDVQVNLRKASEAMPPELQELLEDSKTARAAWEAMTTSQRRMLGEYVASAKQSATRARRATRALLNEGAKR